jgi:hypothetical protein
MYGSRRWVVASDMSDLQKQVCNRITDRSVRRMEIAY